MSTEKTVSKGIRLPESLWRHVEAHSSAIDITPNEWLRRHLVKHFSTLGDVQNPQSDMPAERKTTKEDEPLNLPK